MPDSRNQDSGQAPEQMRANQLSEIEVLVNANSEAPISDLLFDDKRGGIESFVFPQTVPPGNAGRACCVREGMYDLTIGVLGDDPFFVVLENQVFFGGMDHVYTVTVHDESLTVDSIEIRDREAEAR